MQIIKLNTDDGFLLLEWDVKKGMPYQEAVALPAKEFEAAFKDRHPDRTVKLLPNLLANVKEHGTSHDRPTYDVPHILGQSKNKATGKPWTEAEIVAAFAKKKPVAKTEGKPKTKKAKEKESQ